MRKADMVVKALDTAEKISCVMSEYDAMQHVYAGYMLYQTEAHMLEQIGNEPGITASRLAQIFQKTVSACSQIIKKLLYKKLIVQQSTLENARIRKLYLTELGQAIYRDHNRLEARCVNRDAKVFSDVTEQEIEHFLKVSGKLLKCFQLDLEEQKKRMARFKQAAVKPAIAKKLKKIK